MRREPPRLLGAGAARAFRSSAGKAPSGPAPSLEGELQAELDVARQIALVVHPAEVHVGLAVGEVDAAEVDVIQDVKRLGAELQFHPLAEPEVLRGGQVEALERLVAE